MKKLKLLKELFSYYYKDYLKTSFSIDESSYFLTRFFSEGFK